MQEELRKTHTLNNFDWGFNLQMQIGTAGENKGNSTVNMSDGYRINNIINLHFIAVAAVIAYFLET